MQIEEPPLLEDYVREKEAFQELLRRPASRGRLRRWVLGSPLRQRMFNQVVLGTIRWPKIFGRPATKTMAEGFVVEHWWTFHEWHLGLGGENIETETWVHGDPPEVWDAPDEPEHHRVYYMFPQRPNPNQVLVRFAKHLRWTATGPVRLGWNWKLAPRGYVFTATGNVMVLAPITVERTLAE